MNDKSLYVLAGFDEEANQKLTALRQELLDAGYEGTQTKNLPHHITLGSVKNVSEEELCRLVHDTAASFGPFTVSCNHLGIFSGGKVLFVAPEPNRKLLELKEVFGDSLDWTAHITMLIEQPDRVLEGAGILLAGFKPFCLTLCKLHVYEFWPPRHGLAAELRGL